MTDKEKLLLMKEFLTDLSEKCLIAFAVSHNLTPFFDVKNEIGMGSYYALVARELLAKVNEEKSDVEEEVTPCGEAAWRLFIGDIHSWKNELWEEIAKLRKLINDKKEFVVEESVVEEEIVTNGDQTVKITVDAVWKRSFKKETQVPGIWNLLVGSTGLYCLGDIHEIQIPQGYHWRVYGFEDSCVEKGETLSLFEAKERIKKGLKKLGLEMEEECVSQ